MFSQKQQGLVSGQIVRLAGRRWKVSLFHDAHDSRNNVWRFNALTSASPWSAEQMMHEADFVRLGGRIETDE